MKIPKPRKRGDAYRIEIMINGKRHSATRDTARECEQWAATKLLEHKSGNGQTVENDAKPPYSFKQLFDEYWDKVGKHSKSKNWILSQYNTFERSEIYDGYVHLPKTKNGTKRNVPLSLFAKKLLNLIPHENEKIIPQTSDAFRQLWER